MLLDAIKHGNDFRSHRELQPDATNLLLVPAPQRLDTATKLHV
jgi:hypothetical protein